MCFYNDDGEPAEMYNSKSVRARICHKCDSCGRSIIFREQHEYVTYRFQGEWRKERYCNLCLQDRITIARHELDEGCSIYSAWCPLSEVHQYMISEKLPLATEHADIVRLMAEFEEFAKSKATVA